LALNQEVLLLLKACEVFIAYFLAHLADIDYPAVTLARKAFDGVHRAVSDEILGELKPDSDGSCVLHAMFVVGND